MDVFLCLLKVVFRSPQRGIKMCKKKKVKSFAFLIWTEKEIYQGSYNLWPKLNEIFETISINQSNGICYGLSQLI